MRSRYSAYVVGAIAYLVQTTHPSRRTTGLESAYQSTHDSIQWISLDVVESFRGGQQDKVGKVEFRAVYIQHGRQFIHHEKSRFKRYHGKWYYLDGVVN